MKDLYDLFEKILSILKLPISGWSIAFFLLLLLLHKRIEKLLDNVLDRISTAVGGEWGYRRFEPKYENTFAKIIYI
jgi:hypothetical protein